MRIFFSIFSLVGLLASVLVHSLTFFGINAAEYVPWVWVLHLGIFVSIIPMIGKDLREVLRSAPRSVRFIAGAFMAYALINFALFIVLSRGGHVAIEDGKYMQHRRGYVAYEISEADYRWQRTYVTRGFSGHWMIFYLAPLLYSWYRED